ncbi:MAG: efflux RND transporter permease subunit [Polyangiaceae bacterium]
MRHGENALNVIERVKAKLEEIRPGLPAGVEIVPTYDRSGLIERAIATLKHELVIEMLIVSLVILVFLWHVPSAIVPILTIPLSVLLAFIPLSALGVTVNIMSIAGIAISIGVLVDGAIVEVENAYNKIHLWQKEGRKGDFHVVRLEALKEVGPSVFFSLLVIAVAFLPIFALVEQEGRLFKPLAISKTLAMALAALLAVTLDPALRMLFARVDPFTFRPRFLAWIASKLFVGTYYAEERHPISRAIFRVYEPVCRAVLRFPKLVVLASVAIVALSVPLYLKLGREFMPPLNEGTVLYMPTTMPGISVAAAQELLETQDRVLKFHSRGRAGVWQSRSRRHVYRSCAVLHDGDHGLTQTRERVAKEVSVLRELARVVQGRLSSVLARSNLMGRTRGRNGSKAAHPRGDQRVDDADQGAHRHALDGCTDADRHQGVWCRYGRNRADRRANRGAASSGARDPECLRRAHGRGVLRRLRTPSREACPLWFDHCGGAIRAHDRHRRRERDHHDRRATALSGQRALSAGVAGRSQSLASSSSHDEGGVPGSSRASCGHSPDSGALDAPRRERISGGLRLRGRQWSRYWWIRR